MDCELLTKCLFYNDRAYGMAEADKQQYCKASYPWCGGGSSGIEFTAYLKAIGRDNANL